MSVLYYRTSLEQRMFRFDTSDLKNMSCFKYKNMKIKYL